MHGLKPVKTFAQAAGLSDPIAALPVRTATHAFNSLLMSRAADGELTTHIQNVAAQTQFVDGVRNMAVEATIPEAELRQWLEAALPMPQPAPSAPLQLLPQRRWRTP